MNTRKYRTRVSFTQTFPLIPAVKGQNTTCACSKDVCMRCLTHNIKTQITHVCISNRRLVYVWTFVLIIQRQNNSLYISTIFCTSSNVCTMTEIEKNSLHCSPLSERALPRKVFRFCPNVFLITVILQLR